MAYPASPNALAASDMNTALVRPPAQSISYNDSEVRASTGQPSGAVSASVIRGKNTGTIRVTCAYNSAGNAYGWSGGSYGAGGYNPSYAGPAAVECYWSSGIGGGSVVIVYQSGITPPSSPPTLTIKDSNFTVIAQFTNGVLNNNTTNWYYTYQTTTNWFPAGVVRWVTAGS